MIGIKRKRVGMDGSKIGRKKNTPAIVLWIITILLVAGLGYCIYQIMHLNDDLSSKDSTIATQQAEITTLNGKVTELQESASTATDSTDDTSTTSDDAAIVTATKAYVNAIASTGSTQYTYTVKKQVGDFASVSVAPSDGSVGSFAVVLKKSQSVWVVLTSGQSLDETAVEMFSIPTDVVAWE